MGIKEISKTDRPRERLLEMGSEALSDAELLAIIFQRGCYSNSSLDIANKLLNKYGIDKLSQLSIPELRKVYGVGIVKAMQIIAMFEFTRRHSKHIKIRNITEIQSSKDIYDFFVDDLKDKKKEYFYALLLDSAQQIIRKELISIGTLNSSIVHPREIFRSAIIESANSIILVHNHPSGNADPSPEDRIVTRQLKQAGQLVGIKVLDHIIIAGEKFKSV